jgi:predicted dehydrogenase
MSGRPLNVAIVGCGAITELFYVPALRAVASTGLLQVSALVDPQHDRLAVLGSMFQGAEQVTSLADLRGPIDMAIVASPPSIHAVQAGELLGRGIHVLCEKPMARTEAECEAMIRAARSAGRLLAVGLFRRFFPSTRQIHALVRHGTLGEPRRFHFVEGGRFQWRVKSDSLFRRETAGGGVLLDIGAHLLDLMLWWFGEPSAFGYEDDAMGGVEANCRLRLSFPGDLTGEVRLCRDWNVTSRYFIQFDHGWIGWKPGDGSKIELGLPGEFALSATLHEQASRLGEPTLGPEGFTYAQSFIDQLRNMGLAILGQEPLRVPGEEGARSVRFIESCYLRRQPMAMPWLTGSEIMRAGCPR